jgi:hypothetical protein
MRSKKVMENLHGVHGEEPTTSGGNLKAPPMETYLEWICRAWESLSKQLIIDSFPSCGISDAADGKDDERIHVFKVINVRIVSITKSYLASRRNS